MILVLILATTPVGSTTGCREHLVNVARGQLEVFLDPSVETRKRVLERLRRQIPKTDKCDPERDDLLQKYLKFVAAGTSVGDFGENQLSVAERTSLLEAARSRCRDPKNLDVSAQPNPARCSLRHVSVLVSVGDPLARPQLAALTDRPAFAKEGLAWLDFVDRFQGQRSRYMSAALEGTPPQPASVRFGREYGQFSPRTSEPDPLDFVRRRAISALVGRPDPRTWDPEDVALLIKHARNLERFVEKELDLGQASTVTVNDDSSRNRAVLDVYLASLVRMGRQRTFELVDPKKDRDRLLPSHFPLENFLYAEEWKAAHPNETLSPDAETDKDISRRQRETGERAPHPDLDAVRRALDALERGKTP